MTDTGILMTNAPFDVALPKSVVDWPKQESPIAIKYQPVRIMTVFVVKDRLRLLGIGGQIICLKWFRIKSGFLAFTDGRLQTFSLLSLLGKTKSGAPPDRYHGWSENAPLSFPGGNIQFLLKAIHTLPS